MKRKLSVIATIFLMLLLAGCSKEPPVETAYTDIPVTETTEATVPPTVPEPGNPEDVTCKGTYTGSSDALKSTADTVVANMDENQLTNRELQLYYWLAVADYCRADNPVKPDLTQGLDTQVCEIDDSVNSWQQYFLRSALSAWHTHQALNRKAALEDMPTEEAYQPYAHNIEKYMVGKPATKYLYGFNPKFQPNEMHQEWLDAIPGFLDTQASDSGFSNTAQMAAALSGGLTDEEALTALVQQMNTAYAYFTELTYAIEPGQEQIEAYAVEHAIPETGDARVDFRHVLLIPEGAQIDADGTVHAGEDAWNACYEKAQALLKSWQESGGNDPRFAELANRESADEGSRLNGGLYVDLKKGQLMEELDSWCFDPSRAQGDTDIIRTACGWHIVCCVNAASGQHAAAKRALLADSAAALAAQAREAYPATFHYNAISLTGDGSAAIGLSQLLYPDIAHERYPTIPLYIQQDYTTTKYGNFKITTNGCGITTFAMITSYFTDNEWTPPELCNIYGHYSHHNGTDSKLFEVEPAALGYFLDHRTFSWQEAFQAIQDGYTVVCLQYKGYWTRGGHFLALQELTEDGLLVVRDSNVFNYGKLHGHQIDAFNPDLIPNAAGFYWIYQNKIVRIPACVRCGEGDSRNAPELLFREDYHCAKCLTAMNRRGSFLGVPSI